METMISHRVEPEVERPAQEGRILEDLYPRQKIPWRRGRPMNNKEARETRVLNESRSRSVVEKLLMRVVRMKPVEGTSQESGSRMRRMNFMGTNDQDPSHKLKQAILAIAEFYQENRELRQQLATKTIKVSATQGHEGNVKWLKR
jgi:hypothetical protein